MANTGVAIHQTQYSMRGRTVTATIASLGRGYYRIVANNGAQPIECWGAAAAYRTLALMERMNTESPGMFVPDQLLETCNIAVTSSMDSRRQVIARAIAWVVERIGLEELERIRGLRVELMPDAIQTAHAQDAVAWQSR